MEYIEQGCTIKHEGKEFTSGGAFVSPEYLVAYIGDGNTVSDWHGKVIGTYRVISTRPAVFFGHRSWQGSTYYFMRATVGGRTYSLRGFGKGMVAKGRAIKVQS